MSAATAPAATAATAATAPAATAATATPRRPTLGHNEVFLTFSGGFGTQFDKVVANRGNAFHCFFIDEYTGKEHFTVLTYSAPYETTETAPAVIAGTAPMAMERTPVERSDIIVDSATHAHVRALLNAKPCDNGDQVSLVAMLRDPPTRTFRCKFDDAYFHVTYTVPVMFNFPPVITITEPVSAAIASATAAIATAPPRTLARAIAAAAAAPATASTTTNSLKRKVDDAKVDDDAEVDVFVIITKAWRKMRMQSKWFNYLDEESAFLNYIKEWQKNNKTIDCDMEDYMEDLLNWLGDAC